MLHRYAVCVFVLSLHWAPWKSDVESNLGYYEDVWTVLSNICKIWLTGAEECFQSGARGKPANSVCTK
jgi:hypothetical protein